MNLKKNVYVRGSTCKLGLVVVQAHGICTLGTKFPGALKYPLKAFNIFANNSLWEV